MRFLLAPALAGAWAWFMCGTTAAQGDAQVTLTLPDAVRRAISQQPSLHGFEFQLRMQEARIGEAGLRPSTSVGLLVEDFAGTGARSDIESAQTTLSLSHVIELGGKRDARVAAAEAGHGRLRTEKAVLQLDVTAEVARRFVESLHERELLRIAQEGLQQAEASHAAAGRRVQAALAPAVEVARAEVGLLQAKLALEHAEHRLENSRVFLAAAMGDRTVRFGDTAGDLLAIDELAPIEALLEWMETSPDLMAFADEARLRDAQIRLAEVQRRPDIRTEFGFRRYELDDDVAFIAGFNVPLGTGNRARYGIDVARAERSKADTDRESAFLRAQAHLLAQYGEIKHAILEARTLRDSVIPQLESVWSKTGVAYQRGRYSYLELMDAQRELLGARRRLADVAAEFHILRIEIERLTGQSLEAAGVKP